MNHDSLPKANYTQDVNEGVGYNPKRRRSFKPKRVASMLASLVMVLGLAVGAVLVQENQDIRQRAAINRLKPTIAPSPTLEPSFQVEDTFDRYAVHDAELNRIDEEQKGETPRKPTQLIRPPRSDIESTIVKKVMVINFDPTLPAYGGQKLSQYMGWYNPVIQNQDTINRTFAASNRYLKYEVAEWHDVTSFPVKEDGFQYTDLTYMDCIEGNPPNCHQPDRVDYKKILEDFDVCGKRNEGVIDELWLWGGPYFGFYESILFGPATFYYNSPPGARYDCEKQLPVMGLNYERGNGMLHPFGHRFESVMTHLFGGWESNQITHLWERFGLVDAQSPDFNYSGCGSIHFPPNGTFPYNYNNQGYVNTECYQWFNYPNVQHSLNNINCNTWSCIGAIAENQYLDWWHFHIPVYTGIHEGKWNNWWKYVLDFQEALITSPEGECELIPEGLLISPLHNQAYPAGTGVIYLKAGPIKYNTCNDSRIREIWFRDVTAGGSNFVLGCWYRPASDENEFSCSRAVVNNHRYEWYMVVKNKAWEFRTGSRTFDVGTPPNVGGDLSGIVRAFVGSAWQVQNKADIYLVADGQLVTHCEDCSNANGYYIYRDTPPGTYDVYACKVINNETYWSYRSGVTLTEQNPNFGFADIFMAKDFQGTGCPYQL